MKGVIREGDKLTSGGVVTSASSTMDVLGKRVALVGDTVVCPLPGHGTNSIVTGSTKWTNNKPIALNGCKCACGCAVISSLSSVGEV